MPNHSVMKIGRTCDVSDTITIGIAVLGKHVMARHKLNAFIKSPNNPILRYHPHLGLLIPWWAQIARHHLHENPIRSRWRFTLASSSATQQTICGSGVS